MQSLCIIFMGLALALTTQLFASTVLRTALSNAPKLRQHKTQDLRPPPAPPPPPPPPLVPPPPAAPVPPGVPLQPDEVRRHSPSEVDEMKCGDQIPPESIVTTADGESAVTVFVRTSYKGPAGALFSWGYDVEFHNTGNAEVQLLSRHWVFIDEDGRTEEIKGPGAKGAMPVLRPGERWAYSSGIQIMTIRGSMHGWFIFEELPSQRLFAARAGRLALSREGVSELVPCAMAVEGGKLPLTSVYATYVPRRIFVGAVSEISERDDDLHHYTFTVDLQINNASPTDVTVVGIKWEMVDANGAVFAVEQQTHMRNKDGDSAHGILLHPTMALRIKANLPRMGTPTAKISGVILAHIGGADATTADADASDVVELRIAPLGASADGTPVQSYEPLGFLGVNQD